jgi:flagellar biosynthesis GTPase FlhF
MAGINNIIGNNPYNSFAIPEGVKSNETKPENTTNVDKKTGADSKVGTDVSRNEYGDEFLRSSIVKNEDGAVYSKPRNVEADKARVPAEEELPKIDSLIGYTASQVEQFYYEGRISRYDYDVKMEQREELLASNNVSDDSRDAQRVNDTVRDAKAKSDQKADKADVVRQETAKQADRADVVKQETAKQDIAKDDAKKADDSERQVKASSNETYKARKEELNEVDSDAREREKVFNKQMTAISNEARSNEEFEIIESGNDPMATFRVVQNLNNLGSGVEGGTWNIA